MLQFLISQLLVACLVRGYTKLSIKNIKAISKISLFSSKPIITIKDIPLSNAQVTSFGCPKIIGPGKLGSEWLLWHHARDDKFSDDVVKLTTGRVYFATSKDGLEWKYHEDSPALSPSKESGDWFLFDSEHVGLGDVIEPGQVAQSKFKTQEGMLCMYIFGGHGESKPSLGNADRVIKGSQMEIGVAVSQDGELLLLHTCCIYVNVYYDYLHSYI